MQYSNILTNIGNRKENRIPENVQFFSICNEEVFLLSYIFCANKIPETELGTQLGDRMLA